MSVDAYTLKLVEDVITAINLFHNDTDGYVGYVDDDDGKPYVYISSNSGLELCIEMIGGSWQVVEARGLPRMLLGPASTLDRVLRDILFGLKHETARWARRAEELYNGSLQAGGVTQLVLRHG